MLYDLAFADTTISYYFDIIVAPPPPVILRQSFKIFLAGLPVTSHAIKSTNRLPFVYYEIQDMPGWIQWIEERNKP